ncbi:MAG: 30S ribosomal protein S6 [Minisyncoccia bacterium]
MDKQKYELSFWVTSSLNESEAEALFNDITQKIEKLSYQILNNQIPQLKPLSYKIHGETSGYFSYIQFQGEGDNINELRKEIQSEQKILRFLLAKVPSIKQHIREPRRAPISKMKENVSSKEPVSLPNANKDNKEMSLEELDHKLDEILKEE